MRRVALRQLETMEPFEPRLVESEHFLEDQVVDWTDGCFHLTTDHDDHEWLCNPHSIIRWPSPIKDQKVTQGNMTLDEEIQKFTSSQLHATLSLVKQLPNPLFAAHCNIRLSESRCDISMEYLDATRLSCVGVLCFLEERIMNFLNVDVH